MTSRPNATSIPTRPRRAPRGLAAVLAPAALLLALSGCGGGNQDDAGMAEPPQSADSSPSAESSPDSSPESSAETSPDSSSDPSMSAQPSPEAAAEEVVVTIRGFEYEMPESVPAGATITVVNEDSELHTFTATGDGASIDVDVPGGSSATVTAPEEPGTYEVVCELHGGMDAVLEVA